MAETITILPNPNNALPEHVIQFLATHRKQAIKYFYCKIKNAEDAKELYSRVVEKIVVTGTCTEINMGYIIRIGNNIIVDDSRKKHTKQKTFITLTQSGLKKSFEYAQEPMLIDEKEKDQLDISDFIFHECISKRQQQVLYMRYIEKKAFSVIAEELKIPLNTALGCMRYALFNLRKNMMPRLLELQAQCAPNPND